VSPRDDDYPEQYSGREGYTCDSDERRLVTESRKQSSGSGGCERAGQCIREERHGGGRAALAIGGLIHQQVVEPRGACPLGSGKYQIQRHGDGALTGHCHGKERDAGDDLSCSYAVDQSERTNDDGQEQAHAELQGLSRGKDQADPQQRHMQFLSKKDIRKGRERSKNGSPQRRQGQEPDEKWMTAQNLQPASAALWDIACLF
jgi:hypothetical protein